MKLNDYAKKIGVTYRWFKAGKLRGYQMSTGTIIVTEDQPATAFAPDCMDSGAASARRIEAR